MVPSGLTFDPELPLLPVIDDSAAVVRMLAAGPAGASVRRQDTKYEPGRRCVAAQEVTRPGAPPVLGAVVVETEEVHAFPVTGDPSLPGLAEALDAGAMISRLVDAMSAGAAVAADVSCTAVPVRYKPAARCVIRYEVSMPDRRATFYGKVFAGGSSAHAALATDLADAAASAEGAPDVARVVRQWPGLGLMVQAAVPDAVEVHALATDARTPHPQRRALLDGAGRALAGLHSCPLPGAPARSAAEDLSELRGYAPVVARADPGLASRYVEDLELLGRLDTGGEDAVTTHGAMRTDQLVVSRDRFTLIDLDTVCRAEPARDIGNLLAYLDWKAIRRPDAADDVAELGRAFVDGYGARRTLPRPSRLAWYRAASLLKIAGRRYRSLTVREWPLVPALLAAAERQCATSRLEPA